MIVYRNEAFCRSPGLLLRSASASPALPVKRSFDLRSDSDGERLTNGREHCTAQFVRRTSIQIPMGTYSRETIRERKKLSR